MKACLWSIIKQNKNQNKLKRSILGPYVQTRVWIPTLPYFSYITRSRKTQFNLVNFKNLVGFISMIPELVSIPSGR